MHRRQSHGFTLIEMISVMVIMGVIAGAVAVFMQRPIEGYFSSAARAAMSDTADTALRRIARDVRLALPNSVRVSPNGLFLELLPMKTGGRYVSDDTCFAAGCTGFATLGDMLTNAQVTTGSDLVAVFNTYNNSGVDCAPTTAGLYSAYCGHGLATLTALSGAGTSSNTLTFASTVFQPSGGSPTRRVFIIAASPVTFACDGTTGTLWRISGYTRQAAQPISLTVAPLSTATTKLPLALNVTCPAVVAGSVPPRFAYASGVSERYNLLSAWITLLSQNETISLLHQVHVDNTP
jgi:MSHA biogenesis protein MshO